VSGNFLNIATSSTRNLKLMGAGTGEWSGVISNSTGDTSLTAVIKTNSGTWTLSGANKYTGPTSVGGGTLVVNGSIAGGSVTVNSGATLSGSGTITAGVTVNSGGTLSPGNSIGTMTIFGSLGLHGTNVMEVNKSGATFTSDYIQGVSGLTYGGTLKIVATGDPLATGDTFKLYAAGLPSGAFANIDPPTPGNGLIWNTNYLITDGSLRVTTSVNPTPTNILTVVTSNKLDMSWPADHIGWDLQSNVVGVAASNSWFTIQGSATTNSVTVTVDPSKTNVFYRLHLTP
jgi:autotransporter-associated beta strand protein